MNTYIVFSRKVYRKESGKFVPYSSGRKRHICTAQSIEEAREICADGPANKALSNGKEYRHLSFYEFTQE